jgi:signal transduction histidine kinase
MPASGWLRGAEKFSTTRRAEHVCGRASSFSEACRSTQIGLDRGNEQMTLIESIQRADAGRASPELPHSVLLDNSVLAVVCVSADGAILKANDTFVRLVHGGPATGLYAKNFRTEVLRSRNDWAPWKQALSSERVLDYEFHPRTTSGQDVYLKGEIRRIRERRGREYLIGLFADVTKFKQIQSAMQRSARMEIVGGLTSGIAHDFNNLLTVLVGNLYLLGEGVRGDPALFEKTKRARDAAKRGADLTRQLLSFARQDDDRSGVIDPSKLITNLEPLLARALGSRISLVTDVDPAIAAIQANAAQLESVIVNLAINARDAIQGSGTISIKAGNRVIDAATGQSLGLEPGPYIGISVADDGPGIPQAIQQRIFEPFFSTKGTQGTGLGLSMVRWFVEESSGAVSFTTSPQTGTTFTLYLPRVARAAGDTTIDMTMPLSVLPTGTETVIVFANDAQLLLTVKESLEILGYSVHWSSDSRELQSLAATASPDLIVVDHAAPGAVEAAKALNAAVPVIGISDGSAGAPASAHRGVTISKPFTLFDLASTVRRVLDGEPSAQS